MIRIATSVPILLTAIIFLVVQADCKKTVKIGGIFHNDDPASQMAFKYAVEKNNQRGGINFVPIIRTVSSTNSYSAGKIACNLTQEGVVAIFGPASQETRGIVESICRTLGIPNFQTFSPVDPPQEFTDLAMSLNFFPRREILEKALVDLVADSGWESFTILYEDNDGLVRIQKMLENQSSKRISVRELIKDADNKHVFQEILESHETHIVLDCSKDRILEYLRQAKVVGLLETYQTYIVTSLDAHTVDYGEFVDASIVTALRVAYEVPQFRQTNIIINNGQSFYDPSPDTVTLNTALMIDAVNHLTESLNTLLMSTGKVPDIKSISCLGANDTFWNQGKAVYQYITESTTIGMTGEIAFKNSQRDSVKLEIVELSNSGVRKIGDWNVDTGISRFTDADIIDSRKYAQKELVVSSIIGAPYLQLKIPQDDDILEGNDRYEGFSVDLMDSIAAILNISYSFKLVEDNRHGSFDRKNKFWNGIIGELIDRRADAGIADMTITQERLGAVDFTVPFMQTGIAALHTAPKGQNGDLFSFLRPFSLDVWAYIGVSYVGVSILLYVLSRISSNELNSSKTKDQTREEKSKPTTLIDCLWMSMANLLHRGGYIISRKLSSRVVVCVWWFFTLMMISFYTAKLTAVRIHEQKQQPEMDIEDLANQNKIKYGGLLGGSTVQYFKNSDISEYRKIWEAMNADELPAPRSLNEGVDRVKSSKGSYAFLMEASTLEYAASRDCELLQLGRAVGHRGFGIAVPLNSFYRVIFNKAIMKMKEDGTLQHLKTKWWHEKDGGGICYNDRERKSFFSTEYDFSYYKGIFALLIFGLGATVAVAIAEFVWHINKISKQEKVSVKKVFWKEWEAASLWTNKRLARELSSKHLRDNIETQMKGSPLL